MLRFPALAVLNPYLLGDTVLVEPIARELAIGECSYVLSNYPELFIGHPIVHGVRSYAELPDDTRVIDLKKSIRSIEGEGDNKRVKPDKYLNMCKEAGFNRRLGAPKLYLTGAEWSEVATHKKWFDGTCIGVVGVIWESLHKSKNWIYMLQAIRKLAKKNYNVIVFAEDMDAASKALMPKGIYNVTGKLPLRDLMKRIAMVDVMVGPDTGPMHIAGALGIPVVIICFEFFTDLYEQYYPSAIFGSNNFRIDEGISGVAVRPVLKAVKEMLSLDVQVNVAKDAAPKVVRNRHEAFIRMRGLGDLLMSLPAIATMQSMNGNKDHVQYTYITSAAGKKLLDLTGMFDEVVATDYEHATFGRPLPPDELQYDGYTSVHNMINQIDFLPDSNKVPRTDLFARLLSVDAVDYSLPGWKLEVPEGWTKRAWQILEPYDVSPGDKIIAFQVDTKGLSRAWPKVRAKEFSGLAAKRGYKVLLLSDQVYTKYPKSAINLTGKLSISEYVGMIAISTIGVSADSALIHIAGVTDHLALGIFGSVDPKLRIGHYSSVHTIVGKGNCVPCNDWQQFSCREKKRMPECMWGIKAKEVLDKLEDIIKGSGADAGTVYTSKGRLQHRGSDDVLRIPALSQEGVSRS